jgi:zinc/manganese transport system substrate-binding protein
MKKTITSSLLALATLAVAMAQSPAPKAEKLNIVTSFLPIQSHTLAIAGDHANVKQLLAKDTGPHDFQLTPADVKKLSDADLLIINGAGIEEWLGELIKKSGNKNLVVVDTSKGIKLVESPEKIEIAHAHGHSHDHEHHHSHCHGDGANPHIWLDPVIAKKQAANIVAALQKADPANASAYAQNGKAYEAKLATLDSNYRATLAPLPNKNLVTFHDAFPYLAARYKLNYVGAISEFPEKDPSPKQLAALVDKIRSLKVGVLFAENGYAPGLLKKIAAETGATVSELDTLEVGQGTPTAYLDRMTANLESLRKAFGKGD